jgi:hypothetical protein
MPRATKPVAKLTGICAAAAICISGAAAAAVPKGTLTAAEYRQLSAATAALNRAASANSVNWLKARAACARTGRATALLRSQGLSCLNSLGVLEALTNFPAEQRRCTTTKTTTSTTTGTTTTGTPEADSAVIRLMVCMNPRYQALARDAKAVYTADMSARKQALLRDFTGSCLATLASTPDALRKEQQFASASAKLAADVTLLIKVTDGKAPAGDFSQTRIDADVKRFETSATAVLADHSEQRLSSCPHE